MCLRGTEGLECVNTGSIVLVGLLLRPPVADSRTCAHKAVYQTLSVGVHDSCPKRVFRSATGG